jgi:acyl-CoA hydrolase
MKTMKKYRYIKDSIVEMTELVLPNDTNQLGNLLGGRLMHWMDIAAAIAAQRHSNRVCVTAFVDELHFHHPIRLGEVLRLKATVNRAFRTSLEVEVRVVADDQLTGKSRVANDAFFTFVAVDDNKHPVEIAPIIPQTKLEKIKYREALSRREKRLAIESGKKVSK